jgi:hypothetical protein
LACCRPGSGKRFRRCILTLLKSYLFTRFYAICDSICVSSLSTRQCSAATERFFQAESISQSASLSTVSSVFMPSETFFVGLLARNRPKSSLRQCHTASLFSMYLIVASVWYCINNNPSVHLKHPGVQDGSDGSDETSYPLTENHTLPVAQATRCVA